MFRERVILKGEEKGFSYIELSNGSIYTGIRISLIDSDIYSESLISQKLTEFLSTIPEGLIVRFLLNSSISDKYGSESYRSEEVSNLGFISNELTLVFEKKHPLMGVFGFKRAKTQGDLAKTLISSINLNIWKTEKLYIDNLNHDELLEHFFEQEVNFVKKEVWGLETAINKIGIVRLESPPSGAIDEVVLSKVKDSLPLPYEIRVSATPVKAEYAEATLRRASSVLNGQSDRGAESKKNHTESTIEAITVNGERLFKFEFLVVLKRGSEDQLRTDLIKASQSLRLLGEFKIESVGAFPSYESSLPGGGQHYPLYEVSSVLPCFLPVVTSGSSIKGKRKRELLLHRLDGSIYPFDLFSTQRDNYSACIVGKSGRGKSVLTNLLTQGLYNDPDISIIKVDVGGSHTKETKLLGGKEYQLRLDEPSGINPFSYASEIGFSNDLVQILGTLIGVLILEEGEFVLSKALRSDIERSLSDYLSENPNRPDITDFIKNAVDVPRIQLLKRWAKGGVFENVFKDRDDIKNNERLRYYNFSQIFQASDPDFGQGGFAACMAQFNLELLKSKSRRLVFIADETPFFVKRCFSFFKFSTANVRKFGGSFITVSQKLTDLIVNGDTGVLDNSHTKFLFSVDGGAEFLNENLKLSKEQIQTIDSLKKIDGVGSEVGLLDHDGMRVLNIRLTDEEYWKVTSKIDDNRRLENLIKAVPGLTLKEAIRCLSMA